MGEPDAKYCDMWTGFSCIFFKIVFNCWRASDQQY